MQEKGHTDSIFNVFLDVTMCTLVDEYQHVGVTSCLHLQGSLKMAGASSSETSVYICQTTLYQIPVDIAV